MTHIQKQEGKGILGSRECVVFLVDVSGSMGDTMSDLKPKIQVMQESLRSMLTQRVNTQGSDGFDTIAIVTFGGGVKIRMDLKVPTLEDVEKLILYASGGTPMWEGMKKAIDIIDRNAEGMARIVVFSDGHPSKKESILELVKSASDDYGIIVDSVGIGTKRSTQDGDSSWHVSLYDQDFMKKIAEFGHGEFFDLSDGSAAVALLGQFESERRTLVSGVLLLGNGE